MTDIGHLQVNNFGENRNYGTSTVIGSRTYWLIGLASLNANRLKIPHPAKMLVEERYDGFVLFSTGGGNYL